MSLSAFVSRSQEIWSIFLNQLCVSDRNNSELTTPGDNRQSDWNLQHRFLSDDSSKHPTQEISAIEYLSFENQISPIYTIRKTERCAILTRLTRQHDVSRCATSRSPVLDRPTRRGNRSSPLNVQENTNEGDERSVMSQMLNQSSNLIENPLNCSQSRVTDWWEPI
jgi:hypothetical protein